MSAIFSSERTSADDPAEKPIRERQMAAYHRALEYVEGRRVLEIGCGEGIGTSVLAQKAASVVALDYSDEALGVARAKFGADQIEYRRMKVPPVNFPEASFDAVICFQMIEHLAEPERLVAEISRVTSDDGLAILATVNKEETLSDNPYHLHEFTAGELEKLLKSHFGSVEMFGVFGDELFMRYWNSNRKWVSNVMRVDIFNLSGRLPQSVKQPLFDLASRLMRTRLKSGDPELCSRITRENLLFRRDEFDGCLDFFAVCRKAPA